MSEKIIHQTIGLANDLLANTGESVLLHGDLHHFNILSVGDGERSEWKAIDPFGVIGEKEVEVGAFMRNPNLKLPLSTQQREALLHRIEIFHEELGFDRQRMLAWSAVYAGLSAWWTISVGADGWQLDSALARFFASYL
jgi:streptomycin 6-kinase